VVREKPIQNIPGVSRALKSIVLAIRAGLKPNLIIIEELSINN